jgi:hypothetical protein
VRTGLRAATAGLILASPVAAWWLVGDLSERGADDRDRMVRPVELPPVIETLAGVVAVLAVLAALVVVVLAWYRRRLPEWWAGAVVPVCVAGAIVGAGWRVLTASTIGANIGGGMVLLIGLPLAAVLVFAGAMHADRRR